MVPPSLNGGNPRVAAQAPDERGASMGPPSLNGGNYVHRGPEGTAPGGFNGAAVSQRRKLLTAWAASGDIGALQWGRRLSTAEI